MKGNKLYHGYSEKEIFKNEEDMMQILSLKEIDKEKAIAERVEELNLKRERNELFKNNDNKKEIINDDAQFSDTEEAGEIKNDSKSRSRRKKTENLDSDNESIISLEDDKQIKKEESAITLEDIEKIVLTRNFFSKYYNYPIFDENIKGALIRVNWSSLGQENMGYDESSLGYAIGEIDEIIIKENQPYNFNGNKCTKYIKLMISDSDKLIDFTVISNSKILENELKNWKKNRQKMPTNEEILIVQQNIKKIKEYTLKVEELNNILNKKKKDRIKYKDATLNVTEELDLAYEKYRYNKEKYEEAKQKEKEKEKEKVDKKEKEKDKMEYDEEEEEEEEESKIKEKEKEVSKETYLKLMKEAEEDIKQLEKMKEERDRKARLISENDIVAKINEDIKRKQKMDEKLSLLSKKRKKDSNDKEHKIFKRVDCHPTTLFDSAGPTTEKKTEEKEIVKENSEKEKVKEQKKKKNSNNFCYSQKIKQLKDYIDENKNLIEEMMEYEKAKKSKEENDLKEKEENKNNKGKIESNVDMSLFFKLSSINYEMFSKMIKEQNKKNTIDPQVKIIGLSEYLLENNKE